MKTIFGYMTVALAMSAVACGKSSEAPAPSSTLEVTGTVNTQLRTLDNASAVAIGSDGRTFSAYVERNGRFRLSLPVGHVYRIVIANSTMAGELRTVGHLVNPTSSGKSDVIAVKEGGRINLGTLTPAGTSASSLRTKCDCNTGEGKGDPSDYGDKSEGKGGDDGDYDKSDKGADEGKSGGEKDGSDDYKCHQKDQDKDRVCDDSADVELEADNAPGDKCAKGGDDEEAPKVVKKSCSTKDDNHDGKDDDDSADESGSSSGGSGKDSAGKDVPDNGGADKGAEPGDKSGSSGGDSSACTCSKQCGAGASCVASKCAADKGSTPPAK